MADVVPLPSCQQLRLVHGERPDSERVQSIRRQLEDLARPLPADALEREIELDVRATRFGAMVKRGEGHQRREALSTLHGRSRQRAKLSLGLHPARNRQTAGEVALPMSQHTEPVFADLLRQREGENATC